MSNRTSYENHNREYKELKAIVRERAAHTQHNSEEFKFIYQDDIPHGEVLDSHTFTTAIDIGSGTGWFSNYLVEQRKYDKVYGIEPSKAAISIAKKLYPANDKIEYVNGFAEEELTKLEFNEPILISTMCCLAHLPDDVVLDILKCIDEVSIVGSVLVSSDPWGDSYERECWYIRTPEWWSDNMPDWEFEFRADYKLTDPPDRYKGFIAIKS